MVLLISILIRLAYSYYLGKVITLNEIKTEGDDEFSNILVRDSIILVLLWFMFSCM
jgi:hypothetical protein